MQFGNWLVRSYTGTMVFNVVKNTKRHKCILLEILNLLHIFNLKPFAINPFPHTHVKVRNIYCSSELHRNITYVNFCVRLNAL